MLILLRNYIERRRCKLRLCCMGAACGSHSLPDRRWPCVHSPCQQGSPHPSPDIPSDTTFERYFSSRPRKRMLIPEAGADPDSRNRGRHGVPFIPPLCRYRRAPGKKGCFPDTPPSSKIIFLAHKSIPRKIPEKSEKVASSTCACPGELFDNLKHRCDCTCPFKQSWP